MKRTSAVTMLVLASVVLAVFAAPALALDPPQDPALILQEDFEFIGSDYPAYLDIVKIPYGIPPSAAKWGTMTNQHRSGSRALWCAGSVPSAYPYYPVNTQTYATFDLPELADYYSSEVGYWWRQPSYGASDQRAFAVFWRYSPNTSDLTVRDRFGTRSSWAYRTLELSDAAFDVNLSRAAGEVTFEFYDFIEGYGQTPMVGEGAWIDLVSFSGYTYGPVRNLSVSQAGADIELDWDAPYEAIGSTTPDGRSIGYRVWRAEGDAEPFTWTELTSSRTPLTDFSDTTAAQGTLYTYLVQAWDSAVAGVGYGEPQTLTFTAGGPDITVNMAADSYTVLPGTSVEYSYEVENSGDTTLSAVTLVDDQLGTVGSIALLNPHEKRSFTANAVVNSNTTNIVTATGTHGTFGQPGYGQVQDTDSVTVVVSSDQVERLSGTSRINTAVEMSKDAFPSGGADTVVIATAYGWADALPAAALAGVVDGPLLLVEQGSLPSAVRNEILRLGASDCYVIGGSGVVSNAVVSSLDTIPGMSTPRRLGGSNRYATARLVGLEVRSVTGTDPAKVFVATGADFPDALAASSIAAAGEWPILLTQKDTIPSDTKSALVSLSPAEIIVCGGEGVVSASVASQLGSYAPVVRSGGTNRYESARLLVEWGEVALGEPSPAGMFAATGINYPDALAGGPLGGGIGGNEWRPLLLTDPSSLSTSVRTYMRANPSLVYVGVLGGTGAVSSAVEDQLYAELIR